MAKSPQAPGPIESAVLKHHPTEAVMYEAGALDRELADENRSWSALLGSIASFSAHYPSILLRSPSAISAMGRACLQGLGEAPGIALQKRSASLLAALLSAVVDEVIREGADRFQPELPGVVGDLLHELAVMDVVWVRHGHLVPALLGLGRQVLTVGDCEEPAAWLDLLTPLATVLLRMMRVQIEGEPSYDGRWDETDLAEPFQVRLLHPVRREQIEADLRWLSDKEAGLAAGSEATDVFLQITSFSLRDERKRAWGSYFMALSDRVQQENLQGEKLKQLCLGIVSWIEHARDRQLLLKLAQSLSSRTPAAAVASGLGGLLTVLDSFGRAIIERLESEAGRGEIDLAADALRGVVAEVITQLLEVADTKVATDTLKLGLRLRTGPLCGVPFSLEDVVWRINLIDKHPEVARPVLLSLVAGFSLEKVLLRDDRQLAGQKLAGLLDRNWNRSLVFLVRAVIRKTPLSPFHLGGPTTRAHLLALDPENQKGSYLYDLKEKILSHSGRENLEWVEKVLLYWRTGLAKHLDNLASPRSLTNLPKRDEDEHLGHIQKLLENLQRHAPVADKNGVDWLARLPEAFYQSSTLVKVAGFSGCSEKAVSLVEHLLNVYRDLAGRQLRTGEHHLGPISQTDSMLERSSSLLESRRLLLGRLFGRGGLDGLEPFQKLEVFEHEMALVKEEDQLLEALAGRGLKVLDRSHLRAAELLVGHMLVNVRLSGLGSLDLDEVARVFLDGPMGESESLQLLRKAAGLLAKARNDLAQQLQPHVEESVGRLMENALAQPASAYSELLETHQHRGAERVAAELGEMLIDDLLSADGGFLTLENFVHRLLHMLEQY